MSIAETLDEFTPSRDFEWLASIACLEWTSRPTNLDGEPKALPCKPIPKRAPGSPPPAGLNGKTTACRGEANGLTTITDDDVRAMRASKESNAVWAKRLNLHKTTVSNIRSGRRWRHVR